MVHDGGGGAAEDQEDLPDVQVGEEEEEEAEAEHLEWWRERRQVRRIPRK